jgi:hypothetical protein
MSPADTSNVFAVGFFVAGFVVGAVWRSRWALAFPAAVAGWSALPPWHGVGIEVLPWYLAIVLGGSAAAGVTCGILSARLARRTGSRS